MAFILGIKAQRYFGEKRNTTTRSRDECVRGTKISCPKKLQQWCQSLSLDHYYIEILVVAH